MMGGVCIMSCDKLPLKDDEDSIVDWVFLGVQID